MTRVAAIGECMVELTHQDDRTMSLGFAGDTFNTAVYLCRLSDPDAVQVDYVTMVGDDWYSRQMMAEMGRLRVGTGLVHCLEGGTPGAYFVRTDATGERTFTYHRSSSPARGLFDAQFPPAIDNELESYDLLYLSAITLQILSSQALERLWTLLRRARRSGSLVAFDTNYRPQAWSSPRAARTAIQQTLRLTDLAFPTLEDEHRLHGDPDAVTCARRIAAEGVREVVVKNGADPCVVLVDGEEMAVPAESSARVVDTTGAGDSFNAGYLAAKLAGYDATACARAGHAIAAQVIGHRGAILPASHQ